MNTYCVPIMGVKVRGLRDRILVKAMVLGNSRSNRAMARKLIIISSIHALWFLKRPMPQFYLFGRRKTVIHSQYPGEKPSSNNGGNICLPFLRWYRFDSDPFERYRCSTGLRAFPSTMLRGSPWSIVSRNIGIRSITT